MPQDDFYASLGIEPGTIDTAQEYVREAADMGNERVARYGLYNDYYDGEHKTQLLDRAAEYLEASRLRYCENVCEGVVDWLADRMCVESFDIAENEPASEWVNDVLWARNRSDELQDVVHTETAKLGDGFVVVDWWTERGIPRLSWNRPEIVKPVYDNGELVQLSKVWPTSRKALTNPDGEPIRRLNIYFPDRIEKWFTHASDDAEGTLWAPHVDFPEEGEKPEWPIVWTDTREPGGKPLGIPVVHFRNKPQGRSFGRSELRGVIPQQDALNKLLLDLFAVMDAQGWKQRHAAGVPEGTSVKVAIGEWITSTNAETKFGEFSAEDPRPILEAIDGQYRRIAATSRTPIHVLNMTGTPPTGESLKSAEQPGVKKARNRMTSVGNRWEDVAAIALKLQQVFGDAEFSFDPEEDVVEAVWDSPESRDEKAEAETFEAYKRIGVSGHTLIRALGYDPDEEAEKRKDEQDNLGAALLENFDRGNVPGGNGGAPAPPAPTPGAGLAQ